MLAYIDSGAYVGDVLPLRFVPFHQLGSSPNAIVDGSPSASTVITLSHWPGSPTPPELRDDLSAQIVFHALEQPQRFDGVESVSNNHFDQDGVASVYALTQPSPALARRDLVIDIARAGDFGTFRSRDAARLAFAIASLEHPDRTTLDASVLDGSYPVVCGRLYEEVVPRLTEALDHPERWRPLWADEDAHLTDGLAAFTSGVVTIEERADIDLAIVTVPEAWAERTASRFTQLREAALHPMAINQSTERFRVLTMQGHRYRLECRYESWVMYTSAVVPRRPDLRPLAEQLDAMEPGATRWRADAPGSLTPMLRSIDGAESGIAPEAFCAIVEAYLMTAPLAWDPFEGAPT